MLGTTAVGSRSTRLHVISVIKFVLVLSNL